MGILQRLKLVDDTVTPSPKISAQYGPPVMDATYGVNYWNNGSSYGYNDVAIDLNSAMQVPSVVKCRNLICGIVAGIPLELYKKSTGEELGSPVWLDQPDYRQPRSVTISYTVQSLLFYQVAYWEVTDVYALDGRPSRFAWVQNDRVTVKLNKYNTEVDYYMVNNERRPDNGVGSIVTFQSLNPGVLVSGARTIRAALDIERAASVAAATPIPSGHIKNSGADLPEPVVQGLLASWKAARASRSTAYLTSTLDYIPTQFSPKDMMYTDAIQSASTQIARLMNVPAYMLSADANASMTYQNILDARKEFFAYTLAPFVCAIEDRLSMNDITANGNMVRFAVDETFLRVDATERLATIEKLLSLNLITLDQAKEMEDLSPMGDAS
ncbi:Bacteriophage/Gene transfer agent portal protein [uncultured Caudovirales phage]|uniref:Bacteriophage/Gene transfer agent portal protein n=1 Tax=uncultured Caudovirales phage TaxID=2100421 RepID=A0A6J5Q626_9CAUD|nr:Bacteriophage/Gene transfer agent portal protein [uncultured Caudovirales phage]